MPSAQAPLLASSGLVSLTDGGLAGLLVFDMNV